MCSTIICATLLLVKAVHICFVFNDMSFYIGLEN